MPSQIIFRATYTFLILIISASCGLKTSIGGDGFGLDPFQESTDNSFTQSSRELLTGSGSVIFDTLMNSPTSSHGFLLTFRLPEEGASVVFVAYASNQLENGYSIRFWRSGIDLKATFSSPGGTVDISTDFNTINAAADIKLAIQIDNSRSSPLLHIWDDASVENKIAGTALYPVASPAIPTQLASGFYWGLELASSEVSRATLNPAFF